MPNSTFASVMRVICSRWEQNKLKTPDSNSYLDVCNCALDDLKSACSSRYTISFTLARARGSPAA